VLILLDELAKRQATLEAFFQAFMNSGATTVPEILQALDRQRAEASRLEEADQLTKTGDALYEQGRYPEAEDPYRRALAINEKALGPDHPDVATDLNNLAWLLQATGRYAEAEPLYARALAIWEKALGPDHPAVATSLNSLAFLLDATGRYAEAEPLSSIVPLAPRRLTPGNR